MACPVDSTYYSCLGAGLKIKDYRKNSSISLENLGEEAIFIPPPVLPKI